MNLPRARAGRDAAHEIFVVPNLHHEAPCLMQRMHLRRLRLHLREKRFTRHALGWRIVRDDRGKLVTCREQQKCNQHIARWPLAEGLITSYL
jgi:hypothetical protein